MSALFDTGEIEPGRPALPTGWAVYDARATRRLAHHEGPVGDLGEEVGAFLARWITRLGDQGVRGPGEGGDLPAIHADGTPDMRAIVVRVTAPIAERSQDQADEHLAVLLERAICESEDDGGAA